MFNKFLPPKSNTPNTQGLWYLIPTAIGILLIIFSFINIFYITSYLLAWFLSGPKIEGLELDFISPSIIVFLNSFNLILSIWLLTIGYQIGSHHHKGRHQFYIYCFIQISWSFILTLYQMSLLAYYQHITLIDIFPISANIIINSLLMLFIVLLLQIPKVRNTLTA